jgi:FixJ family two-component response regulator
MQCREMQTHEVLATGTAGIVHIVDDDEAVREALIRLIRSDDLVAVGHGNSAQLRNALRPDAPCCVILDMRLRDENGLSVQESLRKHGSTMPIIFLTGYGTIAMTVQAMRGGAAEFLTKPVDDVVLLDAVRRALEFDASSALRRSLLHDAANRLERLTEREREVMALAIGGLMNKQIAGELGISEITAKVHKRRVMEKMSARSLPDLVRMAEMLGMTAARRR